VYVEASAAFEAVLESGESGLVGTIEVKVIDNDGATTIGPTSANITEDGSSGIYIWNAPAAPSTLGQYTIVWSTDGTFDEDTVTIEDLIVVAVGAETPAPIPAPSDGGPGFGPCNAWTTSDEVQLCCATVSSSDIADYDAAVDQASQLLYELSGRLFSGVCSKTVRPCRVGCGCDWQVLSRGYVIFHGDSWGCDGAACGCSAVSEVELSGYPVREITEVKIDGVVIDESEYTLRGHRYLVRKNNGQWPGCQNLSLDDTEEGTWSVTYTYGQAPPLAGRAAATELACEIYKSCDSALALECTLPSGVTRITRQGLTIERNAFSAWGRQGAIWRTGLPLVDLFLNAYNPSGIRRRPVFMTPGRRHYPQNV
jgi:hypothetical protein